MTENELIKLSLETPLLLQRGIASIPPGKTGYLTSEEVRKYAGVSAEEFVAEHHSIKRQTTRMRVEYDAVADRVLFIKAVSH